MYEGLTNEICKKAWDIVAVSADAAHEDGVTNKCAGTIVVCFPHTYPGDKFDVIFIENLASDHPDQEKYERIAVEKAKVSWETGLPSRKVQQDAPHLYRPGMTKWGGSVVENGLIVAFSGVQAVFDEAIAGSMLRWIVAICQDEMTREGGVMSLNTSFIGVLPPESERA
jgi:hypothetical protein